MKFIEVFVAVIIIAVVESQESTSTGTSNMNNGVGLSFGIDKSKLQYIQLLISKLKGIHQTQHKSYEANGGSSSVADDGKGSDEDNSTSNASFTESEEDESNVSQTVGRFGGVNTRQQMFIGYLAKMLKGAETAKPNRRLDFEDNGELVEDLADIDNSKSNNHDFHDQAADVNNRANDGINGYGASLDMKGRSGFTAKNLGLPNLPVNMHNGFYRRAMPRPGFFINPGYYPFTAHPAIPLTNFDNRDVPQNMNRMKPLQFRRVDRQEEGNKMQVLDANAYRYEPQETGPETQINPWELV